MSNQRFFSRVPELIEITDNSQLREMISTKWKTTMERLELKSSVKNNSIKIDEIQRHKGKLIVHWSTKADESKMEPSLGVIYKKNKTIHL